MGESLSFTTYFFVGMIPFLIFLGIPAIISGGSPAENFSPISANKYLFEYISTKDLFFTILVLISLIYSKKTLQNFNDNLISNTVVKTILVSIFSLIITHSLIIYLISNNILEFVYPIKLVNIFPLSISWLIIIIFDNLFINILKKNSNLSLILIIALCISIYSFESLYFVKNYNFEITNANSITEARKINIEDKIKEKFAKILNKNGFYLGTGEFRFWITIQNG